MSAYGLDPGQVRHGLVREERRLEGTRREPLQAADQEGRPREGGADAPGRRAGLQGELRSPQEALRDVILEGNRSASIGATSALGTKAGSRAIRFNCWDGDSPWRRAIG